MVFDGQSVWADAAVTPRTAHNENTAATTLFMA
jgi:hypothetical protein